MMMTKTQPLLLSLLLFLGSCGASPGEPSDVQKWLHSELDDWAKTQTPDVAWDWMSGTMPTRTLYSLDCKLWAPISGEEGAKVVGALLTEFKARIASAGGTSIGLSSSGEPPSQFRIDYTLGSRVGRIGVYSIEGADGRFHIFIYSHES